MKKKPNYFFIILSILFIIFVSYMIAYNSGYYDLEVSKKTLLTQEKLEEFENDIKNEESVDIKNYLTSDYKDYSTPISKVGSNLSASLNNFIENSLGEFFNSLTKLFI